MSDLKAAMEKDDLDGLKAKVEALKQASYKLAEEVYKSQSGGAQAGGEPQDAADAGSSSSSSKDADVEDADYEVVDEDK